MGLKTRRGQALVQYFLVALVIAGVAFAFIPVFQETNTALVNNAGRKSINPPQDALTNNTIIPNNNIIPGTPGTLPPIPGGTPGPGIPPTGTLCGPFGCGTISIPGEEGVCGSIPGTAGVLLDGCWVCSHSMTFWYWETNLTTCGNYWYSDMSALCASSCSYNPPFFGMDFLNNYCYVCTSSGSNVGFWQRRGYNTDTNPLERMNNGCTNFWNNPPGQCRNSNITYATGCPGMSGVPPFYGSLVSPISGSESCWIWGGTNWINTQNMGYCNSMWLGDTCPAYVPNSNDFPNCGCPSEPPNNQRGPSGRGAGACWVCNSGNWVKEDTAANCNDFWINSACPAPASSGLICGDANPLPNPDSLATAGSPGYGNCWLCSNPMEPYQGSTYSATNNLLFTNYGIPCNSFWVNDPEAYPDYLDIPGTNNNVEGVCANALPLTDGAKKPGIIHNNASNQWGCWVCDAATNNYSWVYWWGGRFNWLGAGPPAYRPQYKACDDFWMKATYPAAIPVEPPAPLTCGNTLPSTDPGYNSCYLCTNPAENYHTGTYNRAASPLYNTYGDPCSEYWYTPEYPAYFDIPNNPDNAETVCSDALPLTDGVKKPGIVFDNASSHWGCWLCTSGGTYNWVYWLDDRFDHIAEPQYQACHGFWMNATYPAVIPSPPSPPPPATNGFAWAWGNNMFGQYGNSSTVTSYTPISVLDGYSFTDLSAGGTSACGVDTSGAGWCWGRNDYGQLGNGATTDSSTPVTVLGGHIFTKIFAGELQTCGIDTSGNAWCWGFNRNGQLGNGATTDSSTPVAVQGGHIFTKIDGDSSYDYLTANGNIGVFEDGHSCGIDTTGKAWCWGKNNFGQLGTGNTTNSSIPVAVQGGHVFSDITVGVTYSCGIDTAGAAWCWGQNTDGQLGIGTNVNQSTPVAVTGPHTFSKLFASGMYLHMEVSGGGGMTAMFTFRTSQTCGLDTSGAAWCWGVNGYNMIGSGNSFVNIPTLVPGGHVFADMSSNGTHTCGLDTTGKAWCWGRNSRGVLGDGTTTNSNTPVAVAGGHVFASIKAGGGFNFAMEPVPIPPAPASLTVTPSLNGTSVDVALSWPASAGATGYYIYNSTDGYVAQVTSASTSYTYSNFGHAGETVTFRVYAYNGSGISAGYAQQSALLPTPPPAGTSGLAWSWGYNDTGGLGAGTTSNSSVPVAVIGVHVFTQIAAGSYGSCGIDTSGNAWCWGQNSDGQLGNGTISDPNAANPTPVAVSGGHVFKEIEGGFAYRCGIDTSGAAWCWGQNNHGQLGDGTTNNSSIPVRVAGNHVFTQISSGHPTDITCGLDTSGTAWCWGKIDGNYDNELYGANSFEGTDFYSPVIVPGGHVFTQISACSYGSCGIDTSGAAWCWFVNSYLTGIDQPFAIPEWSNNIKQISVTNSYVCALDTNGAAWCRGYDWNNVLGDGGTDGIWLINPATPVVGGHVFTQISTGVAHVCGLDTNGAAWCWGLQLFGRIGNGNDSWATMGVPTAVLGGHTFIQISAGELHTIALEALPPPPAPASLTVTPSLNGSNVDVALSWPASAGATDYYIYNSTDGYVLYVTSAITSYTYSNFGHGGETVTFRVYAHNASGTSAGYAQQSATLPTPSGGSITPSSARGWGGNNQGQIGDNSTTDRPSPTLVVNVNNFTQITSGTQSTHTCGLDASGTGWCWGYNGNGRLGDGTTTNRLVPTAISGHTFTQIESGAYHLCAIETTGDAYCWGLGTSGEIGDGFAASRTTPTLVAGVHTWKQIAPGRYHTCALDTDGHAWCWGDDFGGQLGNGAAGASSIPVAVTGNHVFTQIATGGVHGCGIEASGQAWCWGYNNDGEIGNGNNTSQADPVMVQQAGHSYALIAAGDIHTCAIDTAGAAWCWGDNSMNRGALGDGTFVDSNVPVAVVGGHVFKTTYGSLDGGLYFTCGIATNGDAYCWGNNDDSEIGNGLTSPSNIPVLVQGGYKFAYIATGDRHAIGIEATAAAPPPGPACGTTRIGTIDVTNCNIAINPVANDTDPGTAAKCWYGAGVDCTGTGCGNDLGGGNYDKYLCNHNGAIAACDALNGSQACGGSGCSAATNLWRLPTNAELATFYPAGGNPLQLCDNNNCQFYGGCNGSDPYTAIIICIPFLVWSSESFGLDYYHYALDYSGTWLPYLISSNYGFSVRCVRTAP